MPGISNLQPAASKAYTLTIGGIDYLNGDGGKPFIPVDLYPITWEDVVGNSVGSMSVTVYDPAPDWSDRAPLRTGQEVYFKRSGGSVIFAGVLVAIEWSKAISGRYASCRIVDFNAWLDWRIVPRLSNKRNTSNSKTVRFTAHDDVLIKSRLFGTDKRHGPLVTWGGFVDRTTGDTESEQLSKGFVVEGATLRIALEEIAEEANYDGVPRQFYVDHQKRLHYYKRREDSNPAPFRLTDQDYAALVASHANIREYWPLTEDPTTDAIGRLGVVDLSVSASALTSGAHIVPNQPGRSRHNAGGANLSLSTNAGATLTCSTGWAFELWFTHDLSEAIYLPLGYGSPDDGPEVYIATNGSVRLRNREDVSASTTAAGVIAANTVYHMVVGQRRGGPELLTNGSFSSDWTGWTRNDADSTEILPIGGPDGSKCARTLGDGTGTETFYQSVAVTAGNEYRFGASVRSISGGTAYVNVAWKDGAAATISTDTIVDATTGSDWTAYSGTFTAPTGAVNAVIQCFIASATTSDVRFDDISFVELDDVTNYLYINGESVAWSAGDAATINSDLWTSLTVVRTTNGVLGDVSHAAWYTGDGLTEAEALEHYDAGRSIIPEDHRWIEDSESETHGVYVRGKNAKGSGWVQQSARGFSHAKQDYLTRAKVDSTNKRNRAGRNYLKRQEDTYTGSFVLTDPEHCSGWRSGQTLYVDDDGIGFTSADTYGDGTSRQPFEVVAVGGEMSGGQAVRLDIEYGTLKRTILRRLARR